MNRQQKELLIDILKQDFVNSDASFIVTLKGIPVSKMQELRKGLKTNGGKLKVAKARLMKLAVKDVPCAQDLSPYLKNQLGIVFSKGDSSSVAKVLYNFSKTNEQLNIIAGCFESKVINKELFEVIATLPSREVLLAQLCGMINAPIAQLAITLNLIVEKQQTESKS